MKIIPYLKIFSGSLLLYSALEQLFTNTPWWFIQNVNLIFHEAGHMFLMFFGRTIHILGGSLFEIGIPLLIMIYFATKHQFMSAAFGAWWLSTAFLSVSIYAADAGEQALPLLGGNTVNHDWHTLLLNWGLLGSDDLFGYLFWLCGICSVILLGYFVWNDKNVADLLQRKIQRKIN